jgi:hypothetical protein
LRNSHHDGLLPFSVKFWASLKRQRNGSRLAAIAVMLSLWTALWALEISPDVHRLLHKDAQNPGHNCLVTQLQRSLVDSGFVAAFAPVPPEVPSSRLSCADFHFYPSYDYRLTLSRGPPSV